MGAPDDEQLVQQIRQGNADALAQYLELKRGALTGFIERQLGTSLRKKIEPDDIFQEAAAEAVKRVDQGAFPPSRCPPRSSARTPRSPYRAARSGRS